MSTREISKDAFFWLLEGICALHRKPFSVVLAQLQFVPPYTEESLNSCTNAYGFDALARKCQAHKLHQEFFPVVVWLTPKHATAAGLGAAVTHPDAQIPALLLQADTANALVIEPGDTAPATIALSGLTARYGGRVTRITRASIPPPIPIARPKRIGRASLASPGLFLNC